MSGTYEDLKVWQIAMDLVAEVYIVTERFPRKETFGLTAQLRRAVVSVPSNIAEGKGRSSDKDLCHFLCQARGSLYEVDTQVQIAYRLGYLNEALFNFIRRKTADTGRLLNGLIHSFRSKVNSPEFKTGSVSLQKTST